MDIINTILGTPLGYIMYFCNKLVEDYGLSIILFAVFAKVILFPISLMVQKNSIRMVKMLPQLNDAKIRYEGDKDKIAEEQMALYHEAKYRPSLGCLPTLVQIPIILGLINVIYRPLQHLFHVNSHTIDLLISRTCEILHTDSLGYAPELEVIKVVQQNASAFESLRSSIPDYDSIIVMIQSLSLDFMGIDLSQTPSVFQFNALLWIPILSGISALSMCVAQNYMNVLQREQGLLNQWGMTIFLTIFSIYFTFVIPAGVGLYWIVGNIAAIFVGLLCNVIYNPKKYINYNEDYKKKNASREEKKRIQEENSRDSQREKADLKRFEGERHKRLVFYVSQKELYVHLKPLIEHIIDHSDETIHYVTGDSSDEILFTNKVNLKTYYIGAKLRKSFLMGLETEVFVSTMPEWRNDYIKRSSLSTSIKYIYVDYGVFSPQTRYRDGSIDRFDTVFCTGMQQVKEIQEFEKAYKLPRKELIQIGNHSLSELMCLYNDLQKKENSLKKLIILCSWRQGNLVENGLDRLLSGIDMLHYNVIIRPATEFCRRFPQKVEKLLETYRDRTGENFRIETEELSPKELLNADIVITDWDALAYEYALATQKPIIFINTPMKPMNPEFEKISMVPAEVSLREKLGICVDLDNVSKIQESIQFILEHGGEYKSIISQCALNYGVEEFPVKDTGGQYIIELLDNKERT